MFKNDLKVLRKEALARGHWSAVPGWMAAMSDWLGAGGGDGLGSAEAKGGSIDAKSREQIAVAARLLRSICPNHGDVEILLHEMARALERVVETGTASSVQVGVSVAQLNACAPALE